MKYSLLLLFSIFSFTYADSNFHEYTSDYDPNEEIDKLWKEHYEKTKATDNNSQSVPNSGIFADQILTAKRKHLDPELADLVIGMSEKSTQELAQLIQECAKNPNKKCPQKALLVGAPGIGKTTYIQAVSEKAGIPFVKINSAFVSDKYKDSGPDNLKAIFKPILQTKNKILVAFDELHCLTDGHKNINNPNQNTAEALWLLIDQCAENPNIILVGIMNDGSNMPEQLKSRFRTQTYIMKSSDEVTQKQRILHLYLKKFKHACDEKCQRSVSKSLKTAEARAIEGIVESADQIASLGKEIWEITQKDLETAVTRTNETEKVFDKKELDQATKTLIAQEREANSGTIRNYATVGAIGGTGVAYIVDKNGGWAKVWEGTKGVCIQLGKVALVITKHTLKAGAEYCVDGKIPNPKKVIQDMVKDEIFVEVKVPNDKEQK